MFYVINLKKYKKLLNAILAIGLAAIIFLVGLNALYPVKYINIIEKNTERFNLEIPLALAIMRTESRFDKNALSRKDAKGLMQITDQTAYWAAEELGIPNFEIENLYDPEINILIGCWYVDKLLRQFNDDLALALAAYNGGSGNVSKWLKDDNYSKDGKTLWNIPYKETDNYVKKTMNSYKIYRLINYFRRSF